MKFKVTADAIIEADNIDDAFWKLAKHFQALYDDRETEIIFVGVFKINKIEEPK